MGTQIPELEKAPIHKAQTREQQANLILFLQYLREMSEVTIGLGVIVISTLFLPNTWVWFHIIFCTLFLMVCAIAIRYQTATAYSAGFLAALSYSLLLWQDHELNVQVDNLQNFVEPSMLLLSSVLLSNMLRSQRHGLIDAEQQCARADEALQQTTQQYQTALTINAELERKIAGQSVSPVTITEKMTKLWKLNGNEYYAAILDIIMYAVGAQSCALYMQNNGQFYLCASQPTGITGDATPLALDDPLINQVIHHRQVVTVHDLLAEAKMVPQKVAVMAGPLIDRDEQVVGIVTIDNMPLPKFTFSAVRLFRSILSMVSMTLQMDLPLQESDGNEYLQQIDMAEHSQAMSLLYNRYTEIEIMSHDTVKLKAVGDILLKLQEVV